MRCGLNMTFQVEFGANTTRLTKSNVVVLDPDVAAIFPDSASVNEALRLLAKIAKSVKS
jgi:hypothetical protein